MDAIRILVPLSGANGDNVGRRHRGKPPPDPEPRGTDQLLALDLPTRL